MSDPHPHIDVAQMRDTYDEVPPLKDGDLGQDPIAAFSRWLEQAVAAEEIEPTAMTLATTSVEGVPDARIVLLKGVDPEGFRFFTNYDSAKSKEIGECPRAALVFWWQRCNRQVRAHTTTTLGGMCDETAGEEWGWLVAHTDYHARRDV